MEHRFFDFTTGAKISKSQVDTWHEQILSYLKSGGSDGVYTICSGNSIVIGSVVKYSHDPENPVIVIYEITNGYKKYEYMQNQEQTTSTPSFINNSK